MAVKKKVAAKKAPAKKAAAKKAPAVEFSNAAEADAPVAKKTATKKAAAKKTASTKTAAKTKKSTASKAHGGQGLPRDLNDHGFVKGSDSEKIVEILLEGGESRVELNAKIAKALGKNKNGNDPNVSSLTANILKRLRDKGYTIEQSWVLREPTPASKAAATRAAKKAAAKAPEKAGSAPVTAKKTAARKKAAKKAAKPSAGRSKKTT